MSNSQHQTNEPYGRRPALEPRPGSHADPYADVHAAETLAYGVYAAPAPYPDTYRPAYEAHEPAQPALPRQEGRAGGGGAPSAGDGASVRQGAPDAEWAHTRGGARRPEGVSAAEGAFVPEGARGAAGGLADVAEAEVVQEGVGRRGVRRRKARSAERSDGSVRRLLPQALVVVFLAGGTTAFVAKDKAIELTVDGKPRTLHTFADDVDELLAQQGVDVGAHDVVAPAPGTALASGDEVAVHYGRPVRLTIDGQRHEVWTTAHTVEEALDQMGVRAEGAYLSISRSQPIGRAGLALDVRTERAVTVMADGRPRTVRTNAATVREVIEEAGVTLHGEDTTSVPGDSFPRDGQTVTVLRVTGTREVREEAIPFRVERKDDPSLFKGTEVVEQVGEPGLRRITYSLRTVNGVRQKPRKDGSEVVRRPRKQVVKVGTKPLPTSVSGADGLNWQGLAACESGGRPNAVDPSGTYGGLYQFDTRTWHSLGGSGRPQDASAAEQTLRAKKLYLRRGGTPWPHCGARLHG